MAELTVVKYLDACSKENGSAGRNEKLIIKCIAM